MEKNYQGTEGLFENMDARRRHETELYEEAKEIVRTLCARIGAATGNCMTWDDVNREMKTEIDDGELDINVRIIDDEDMIQKLSDMFGDELSSYNMIAEITAFMADEHDENEEVSSATCFLQCYLCISTDLHRNPRVFSELYIKDPINHTTDHTIWHDDHYEMSLEYTYCEEDDEEGESEKRAVHVPEKYHDILDRVGSAIVEALHAGV